MSQQSTEPNNFGYSSSNSNKDNNINSNNDSNNDSNINFIQDGKLTGSKSTEKRGQWSESRKLAAVEASISHRPFDKKKNNVTVAWDLVLQEVNKVDPHLRSLGLTSLRNYLKKARKEIIEKKNADRLASGTNDSETTLENRLSSMDDEVINLKI